MRQKLAFAILVFPLLGACETKQPAYSSAEIVNYSYRIPLQLSDGWETAKPEPRVILFVTLEDGVRAIMRNEYPHIHSILVAHQGKLVFEEYFPGFTLRGGMD